MVRALGPGGLGLLVAALALACSADALRTKDAGDVDTEWPHFFKNVAPGEVKPIPRTHVPMPSDYEDYTRGHGAFKIFPDDARIPGKRTKAGCPGEGLPCFDPADAVGSKEVWMPATERDLVGRACAPGGKGGVGHYFYNVWVPEIIPFVVPEGTPGRKDTAVLVAPGGGFKHLVWEPDPLPAAEWLNSIGISAFVLKYRLPNKDVSLLDAQRAMSLVRSRAQEYGLNASRIGFYGGSAGGNVGLRLGSSTQRGYARIDAVDDFDHRPNFMIILYPGLDGMSQSPNISYSLLPPIFSTFAEDDPCVRAEDVRALFAGVASVAPSVQVEQHPFPDGSHGFAFPDFWPALDHTRPRPWTRLAKDWMQRKGFL